MERDGAVLKDFVEARKMNKTALAKNLSMSKRNLYQLFATKEFEEETIKKLEKSLKIKWSKVKETSPVNIDVKVSHETFEEPKTEYKASDVNAINNLSEANLILARNNERLVTLLEERLSKGEKQFNEARTPMEKQVG